MIRVVLPYHLRNLANVGPEVTVEATAPVTLMSVLRALETKYPALLGTIRDHNEGRRRPFVRYFVCEQDWSHDSGETELPASVASGQEPIFIIGAIAGG